MGPSSSPDRDGYKHSGQGGAPMLNPSAISHPALLSSSSFSPNRPMLYNSRVDGKIRSLNERLLFLVPIGPCFVGWDIQLKLWLSNRSTTPNPRQN